MNKFLIRLTIRTQYGSTMGYQTYYKTENDRLTTEDIEEVCETAIAYHEAEKAIVEFIYKLG